MSIFLDMFKVDKKIDELNDDESERDESCSNHHFDRSKADGTEIKLTGSGDKTFIFVERSMTCMHENCSASKTSTTRMYKRDMALEDILKTVERDEEEVFNLEY